MGKLIHFPIQFSINQEEEFEMYSDEEIDKQFEDYYGYEDELSRENWQKEEERIRIILEEYEHKESWFDKLINKLLG